MQAGVGEYSVIDLLKEDESPARTGRDSHHTSGKGHQFVLLFAEGAAKDARLTAEQLVVNEARWKALDGVWCASGLSAVAVAAGKNVAAVSLDVPLLESKGCSVRSVPGCSD